MFLLQYGHFHYDVVTAIYLFVPMLMYLATNEETRNDLLIVILWGLLLVPRNYYTIGGEQNIGMVINPLLLIGLPICIIPGAFSVKGIASASRFVCSRLRSIGHIRGTGKSTLKLI